MGWPQAYSGGRTAVIEGVKCQPPNEGGNPRRGGYVSSGTGRGPQVGDPSQSEGHIGLGRCSYTCCFLTRREKRIKRECVTMRIAKSSIGASGGCVGVSYIPSRLDSLPSGKNEDRR